MLGSGKYKKPASVLAAFLQINGFDVKKIIKNLSIPYEEIDESKTE